MYVIYHADCLDGLAAAWLMHRKYPLATYIPAEYGDPLPQVNADADIFIVDFSYTADQLIELCQSRSPDRTVVVCDHHKSAIEHLLGYWKAVADRPSNLELHLDLTKSGAGIVWDLLQSVEPDPTLEMPLLIKHIQDRDLWKFKYPQTRLITAAIMAFPLTFETLYDMEKMSEASLLSIGEVARQKDQRLVDWHLKHSVRMVLHEGNEVFLANVPRYIASEVGSVLARTSPYVFLYYDGVYQRHVSLRSLPGPEVCVDEIAALYGGGGHASAAGFKLPFTERFWPEVNKPPRTPKQRRTVRDMWIGALLVIAAVLTWIHV